MSLTKKTCPPALENSRDRAVKRYLHSERSLSRSGKWKDVKDVMEEYFQLGQAERVPCKDLLKPDSECYYLPYHGVVKVTSTTTKVHVVFDASAQSTTGNCLNDLLIPGSTLYPPLFDILLKFRLHKIGMSTDVGKMFLEVGLHKEDRDLHCFLWRYPESGKLKDFRMTCLTFGVACSPFLAVQVLRQVALDYQQEYPLASQVVLNNFYIDDCLTGTESVEEALLLRSSLNDLLSKARMTLRKWRASCPELLDSIPLELKESEVVQTLPSASDCHKAPGLHWDTARDTLHISTPELLPICESTMR